MISSSVTSSSAVDPVVWLPGFCFLSYQREHSLWTGWCVWQNDSPHGMKHQNQFVLLYWSFFYLPVMSIFQRGYDVNTKVSLTCCCWEYRVSVGSLLTIRYWLIFRLIYLVIYVKFLASIYSYNCNTSNGYCIICCI